METEIVVAILALIGTLTGSYFANKKTTALVVYRLEQLENKVHAHNNLVERMYHCEEEINLLKKDRDTFEEKIEHYHNENH